MKHLPQNIHHKFHRGEVIIVQQDLIQRGFFDVLLRLGDHTNVMLGLVVGFPVWHGFSLSSLDNLLHSEAYTLATCSPTILARSSVGTGLPHIIHHKYTPHSIGFSGG